MILIKQEALDILLSLPIQYLSNGWIQVQIANCYFENSNYLKAIHHYQLAQYYSPYVVAGMEYFSSSLWQLRRRDELSALAHQLHALAPYAVQTCIATGNVFSLEKDHEAALKFFQKALQIDPFNAYVHTLAAHEFVFNEDLDKAFVSYRHALRLNERLYNAWYGMGNIYLHQEKFKMAVYHFQRAVQIHPSNSVLFCHLGMAYKANKEFEVAVEVLQRAASLEHVPSHARFQLANALLSLNRYDQAVGQLESLLRFAPKEAAVYFLLGKVHLHLGNNVKAMTLFNIALDLDPKDNNQVKSQIEKLPKGEMNDINFDSNDESDEGILHDSDLEDINADTALSDDAEN